MKIARRIALLLVAGALGCGGYETPSSGVIESSLETAAAPETAPDETPPVPDGAPEAVPPQEESPSTGDDLLEPHLAKLKDENPDVRKQAINALNQIDDPRTIEPLIAALRDENADVRRRAAFALGGTGNTRIVEPLVAALDDEDEKVRQEIVESLSTVEEPAVEPLLAALNDDHARVRAAAAQALGLIGDGGFHGISPLRETSTPHAIGPLIAALEDEDEAVRSSAAEALAQITGQDFGESSEEWRAWWQENQDDYLKAS